MRKLAPLFSLLILLALLSQPAALACGRYEVAPVFDYKHAPENPYINFAAGRIGIVKPTYRRAVLVGAYRYLTGGAFSADEQQSLVDVWNAVFNNKDYRDDDVSEAVKKWLETRKRVADKEEKLPAIYVERQYGGYDFFPNCTKSAFETAAATLNDRIGSYGAEDKNVRNWLAAQDAVFTNCASGASMPETAGAESPEWLQKDRAYQIGAAAFYSLNYPQARAAFAAIAQDEKSPWQETADYLVGRTLVRQASLDEDSAKSRDVYLEAEIHLQTLLAKGGKFRDAAQKLLNLVKYRTRPEERVRELANNLSYNASGENLRQDLIDYTWLLDKFEAQTLEAEQKRKESLISANNKNTETGSDVELLDKIVKGETLSIGFSNVYAYFKPDVSEQEIIKNFEEILQRKLNDKDVTDLKESIKIAKDVALQAKKAQYAGSYEGGFHGDEELTLSLVPEFLRYDDLTDWLFVYQIQGVEAYEYSLKKWRETDSNIWLMSALSKASKSSPEISKLLEDADKANRDSPAFPTIAFHTSRLLLETGKRAEARKLLDDVLNSGLELPVSTRNQFLEMRFSVAQNLDEFLQFALRKSYALSLSGEFDENGDVAKLIEKEKEAWEWLKDDYKGTREDYFKELEARFRQHRLWENRYLLTPKTAEIISERFPLELLIEAARSDLLPDYWQREFLLTAWTRAVLLNREDVSKRLAPEIGELFPELFPAFEQYLKAKTPTERKRAELYVLLKHTSLSPFVKSGIPEFKPVEENDYYLEAAWWCEPLDIEYTDEGDEIPKKVATPDFLTKAQLDAAAKERTALVAVGEGADFLGKKVLEWARLAPKDERLAEALFIAVKANESYKYGCDSWDSNEEIKTRAETILRTRFPGSFWTGKLTKVEEN